MAMNSHNQKTDYSNEFYCSFEITSVRGGLFERIANEWVSANECSHPVRKARLNLPCFRNTFLLT